MLEISQECTLNIDYTNKRIRIAGEVMRIDYSFKEAEFPAMSSEGFTDYMKFDTAAMIATIDTIFRVNYKNPVANVKITPVDEGHASIEFNVAGRYGATVTMAEVHMLDMEREITLPIAPVEDRAGWKADAVFQQPVVCQEGLLPRELNKNNRCKCNGYGRKMPISVVFATLIFMLPPVRVLLPGLP